MFSNITMPLVARHFYLAVSVNAFFLLTFFDNHLSIHREGKEKSRG